jgi:hypothetical protein
MAETGFSLGAASPVARDLDVSPRRGTGTNQKASFQTKASRASLLRERIDEEAAMPVWAWVLIIVLLVLLLSGGIYVRR